MLTDGVPATATVGVPETATVEPGESATVGTPVRFTFHGEASCMHVTVLPGARLTSPVTFTSHPPPCCATTLGVPAIPTFQGPLCVALTVPAMVVVPVATVGTGSASVFVT